MRISSRKGNHGIENFRFPFSRFSSSISVAGHPFRIRSEMPYKAVVFDLYGTLVRNYSSRIPLLFRSSGAICGTSICCVIFMQQEPLLSPSIRASSPLLRDDMFIASCTKTLHPRLVKFALTTVLKHAIICIDM